MANEKIEMISDRALPRVEVSGIDDEDLAKLMEDTASFIRDHGRKVIEAAGEDDDLEMLFKRVDLGDFVIVTNRS